MIYRILGILILLASFTIISLVFKDDGKLLGLLTSPLPLTNHQDCIERTPAQQLAGLIKNDFDELLQKKQLPPEWSQIGLIKFQMNSVLAAAILGSHRPQIKRVQDGSTFLEVEVLDLPDESNPGIIVQASLFDIRSQNKIFEIGRTYTMDQLNKVHPPAQENTKENP